MMKPHRSHPLWIAFALHRASGLALALFLPLHFLVLALALNAPERLDRFLDWTDLPSVKAVEFGLVFLLAAHFFGGLRLLALEFLPWTGRHKALAAGAVACAFLVAAVFLLNAV